MLLKRICLIVISFTLILISCKDKEEDSVLSDSDIKRNNIIGDWIMKQSTQEFRADTLYTEYGSSFDVNYTFAENGTGFSKFFTFENKFDWLFQYNPPQISIKDKMFQTTQVYDITKNEKDRQIWEFENEITDSTGIKTLKKHTLKFSRE